jgi:hypothetical protein
MRAFAEALDAIPMALAENSGLSPIESLASIKSRQVKEKNSRLGVDCMQTGSNGEFPIYFLSFPLRWGQPLHSCRRCSQCFALGYDCEAGIYNGACILQNLSSGFSNRNRFPPFPHRHKSPDFSPPRPRTRSPGTFTKCPGSPAACDRRGSFHCTLLFGRGALCYWLFRCAVVTNLTSWTRPIF